jgi:hypothetical protein
VPSLFWWLIASYGNHTRASLLHDALYVDEGPPPVPRRTADRLFLTALREPGPQKGSAFRHWLMWAAVSAFGTMRWHLGVLFALQLVAVWALTIWAVVWAWGDGVGGIGWNASEIALALLAGLVFLVVVGSSWRAGVDLRGGWLVPGAMTSLLIVVPLANEWTYPFELELDPFTLLVAALGLTLTGPLWGLWVDPTLRGWLWPTVRRGTRYADGGGGISATGQGLPPRPQFFGLWPSTITQVCSLRPGCVASPSASVSFSMSAALVSSLMR